MPPPRRKPAQPNPTQPNPTQPDPTQLGRSLRVLVASHSHPAVTKGGAEIAAYAMFQALQAHPNCQAWFLGCDRALGDERPGAVLAQPFSADEYLYAAGAFDWFKFANPDRRFPGEITRLFLQLVPDVVHFHHFIGFGLEVLAHLRRALPACRIVLTLHEYLAICHNFGQMITTSHGSLCSRSGPRPCHDCFPEHDRSDFYLRRRYIARYFDLVDCFVAPSHFLAARYVDWGLPAEKITVLDNFAAPAGPVDAVRIAPGEPLRIGFFGQLSTLKGVGVLLDAAAALVAEPGIAIEIFGDHRSQPPAFQAEIMERLGKAGPNVRFHGRYDPGQVDRLMRTVHAVIVPSIWWENAPLVIAEARRNRRPVICSDIGGMAEKVRDGVDGWHFAAGNVPALTSLLRRLSADRDGFLALTSGLSGHTGTETSLADILRLYRPQPD